MSISLSNHEDRIKALENTSNGSIVRVVTTNRPLSINVSHLISQGYNAFIVMQNSWSGVDKHIITSVLFPEYTHEFEDNHHYEYQNNRGYTFISLRNGVITTRNAGFGANDAGIYGYIALKLYYNFSYNIIRMFCFIFKKLILCSRR